MIIDLKTIPQDVPKHFEFCLEKGWWNPDEQDGQIRGISNPVTATVDIYKAGDKYILEGEMNGSVRIRCDRCLGIYDFGVKTGFKLFFAKNSRYGNKAEIELLEEDMETGFINGDEIELDDIFKEQLYLSLPIKSLCKDECLGLCPVCGTDLNIQRCNCRK
jgi:uncharacterized protein